MGLFDSVNFFCPHCDAINEVQSKAGECTLATYPRERVPVAIAEDLNGCTVYCSTCEKPFNILSTNIPKHVTMITTKDL